MPIHGILFDIDGTLVLSNDAHARAWVDAFAAHGITVAYEQVRPLIGMGSDKLLPTIRPDLSKDTDPGKAISADRQRIFLERYVNTLDPARGSRDLVRLIQSRGMRTLIATSAKPEELQQLLTRADVADLLTEATTAQDAQHSKPDPDIVAVALQKIGLPAHEVLMVGDTPYDIASARASGVHCVAMLCGGWSEEKLDGALRVFGDPGDMLYHFDALLHEADLATPVPPSSP